MNNILYIYLYTVVVVVGPCGYVDNLFFYIKNPVIKGFFFLSGLWINLLVTCGKLSTYPQFSDPEVSIHRRSTGYSQDIHRVIHSEIGH